MTGGVIEFLLTVASGLFVLFALPPLIVRATLRWVLRMNGVSDEEADEIIAWHERNHR